MRLFGLLPSVNELSEGGGAPLTLRRHVEGLLHVLACRCPALSETADQGEGRTLNRGSLVVSERHVVFSLNSSEFCRQLLDGIGETWARLVRVELELDTGYPDMSSVLRRETLWHH